jgi:hypothetical protein
MLLGPFGALHPPSTKTQAGIPFRFAAPSMFPKENLRPKLIRLFVLFAGVALAWSGRPAHAQTCSPGCVPGDSA